MVASASPLGAEMMTRPDAATEVAGRLLAGGEEAGGLDHDVDAVVAPRDLGRIHDLELVDLTAVDREAVVGALHVVGERAADRVVLEQEGDGVAVTHRVVHRHQLDPGVGAAGEQRPGERAPDAPETVDSYTNRHWTPPHLHVEIG